MIATVGMTTSTGFLRSLRKSEIIWIVLPMPISSASRPPFQALASCALSQCRPSSWNGSSLIVRPSGCAACCGTGSAVAARSVHTVASSG